MFVTLRELAPAPRQDPTRTPYTRVGSKDESGPPSQHAQSKPGLSHSKAVSGGKKSSVDHDSKCSQLGQRVAFYDKHGTKHYGVVQWIGKESRTRKFEYTVVGIKTVSTD